MDIKVFLISQKTDYNNLNKNFKTRLLIKTVQSIISHVIGNNVTNILI